MMLAEGKASACSSKATGEISSPLWAFIKSFLQLGLLESILVSRQLQSRAYSNIRKFPGPQELFCLKSNSTFAPDVWPPSSLEGVMGKVWENKNFRFYICFSENSFSCK